MASARRARRRPLAAAFSPAPCHRGAACAARRAPAPAASRSRGPDADAQGVREYWTPRADAGRRAARCRPGAPHADAAGRRRVGAAGRDRPRQLRRGPAAELERGVVSRRLQAPRASGERLHADRGQRPGGRERARPGQGLSDDRRRPGRRRLRLLRHRDQLQQPQRRLVPPATASSTPTAAAMRPTSSSCPATRTARRPSGVARGQARLADGWRTERRQLLRLRRRRGRNERLRPDAQRRRRRPRDRLQPAPLAAVLPRFGYPAVQPPLEFNGLREFRCDSPLGGTDDPPGSGPDTMWIGCDMTARLQRRRLDRRRDAALGQQLRLLRPDRPSLPGAALRPLPRRHRQAALQVDRRRGDLLQEQEGDDPRHRRRRRADRAPTART